MGFALFTKSGTFNPSDYGLVPGDVLSVVVVGGGGGGCGYTNNADDSKYGYPGTAGGASSFGSYISAAGGGSGNSVGQSLGGYGDAHYNAGGGGAGGWYPGVQMVNCPGFPGFLDGISPGELMMSPSNGGCGGFCRPAYLDARALPTCGTSGGGGGAVEPGSLAGVGGGGGTGLVSDNTDTSINYASGGGGAGYGAGGGGGARRNYDYAGSGGNSGIVMQKMVKLPSMSAIPVTVGAGGAANGNGGGTGAPGCVAVFW